jgi:hypothetical protein
VVQAVAHDRPVKRVVGKGKGFGIHADALQCRIADACSFNGCGRQVNDGDFGAQALEEVSLFTISAAKRENGFAGQRHVNHLDRFAEPVAVQPGNQRIAVIDLPGLFATVMLPFVIFDLTPFLGLHPILSIELASIGSHPTSGCIQ